jgi:hypothetical protein
VLFGVAVLVELTALTADGSTPFDPTGKQVARLSTVHRTFVLNSPMK